MVKAKFPWGKVRVERQLDRDSTTPLIYYGGKSRDAQWIINNFPPHSTFVDTFGGGAAITFAKRPSVVDIYNDIGNVANFLRVMRDHGGRLYQVLYQTPFSRQEFYYCRDNWPSQLERYKDLVGGEKGTVSSREAVDAAIEWARMWFVVINQGYTHEENSDSWRVVKQVDGASGFRNHVDDIPFLMKRLREVVIENMCFSKLIPLYDLPGTLFYCDPPYYDDTRASHGNYLNEMTHDQHVELLSMLNEIQGQAVVSGYDSELYNDMLSGWRTIRKTAKSAIQNSKSLKDRGDRTEVLWIKEHAVGLWAEYFASPDVAKLHS